MKQRENKRQTLNLIEHFKTTNQQTVILARSYIL